MKITGPLALSMQRHFVVSWNSSADQKVTFDKTLFPEKPAGSTKGIGALGQFVAGGPIYPKSNIMLSYFRIFTLAKHPLKCKKYSFIFSVWDIGNCMALFIFDSGFAALAQLVEQRIRNA